MGITVWAEVERSPENEPKEGILSFAFYQKIFTVEMQFKSKSNFKVKIASHSVL